MTQVISLRVPSGKVAAIDRRALDAGLDRTKYLLRIVDEDLADACVVRMSELFRDSVVFTVDRTDFLVYRRHGRQAIPCVFPG